jgi:hypothetical protein
MMSLLSVILKWKRTIICCASVLIFLEVLYRQHARVLDKSTDFEFSNHYPTEETLRSLSLTHKQCEATFPGLTREIDIAIARGPFELRKGPDVAHGSVEGRIKDGKVG